jgi:hypothetical protein
MADWRKRLPVWRIEAADDQGDDPGVIKGTQRAAAGGAEGAA